MVTSDAARIARHVTHRADYLAAVPAFLSRVPRGPKPRRWRGRQLAVLTGDVVDATDRRPVPDSLVGSLLVVVAQPVWQGS